MKTSAQENLLSIKKNLILIIHTNNMTIVNAHKNNENDEINKRKKEKKFNN